MSDDAKDWAIFWLMLFILAATIGRWLWFSVAQCEAQWAQSGLASEWRWPQGCMVQRKDGTWVPSSVMRDFAP